MAGDNRLSAATSLIFITLRVTNLRVSFAVEYIYPPFVYCKGSNHLMMWTSLYVPIFMKVNKTSVKFALLGEYSFFVVLFFASTVNI